MAGLGAFNVKDMIDAASTSTTTSKTNFGVDGGGGVEIKLGRLSAFAEAKIQNVFTKTGGLISRSSIQTVPVTFGLLLNLAGVLGTEATAESLAEYVANYIGEPADSEELTALIEAAVAYNRDFVAPTLHKRAPQANEAEALGALDTYLASVPEGTPAEDLQTQVYEIGKNPAYGFENLRDWFRSLYETLLGSSQGPRMGSFIALYGIANTRRLIAEALAR